jgi:hypothetical protein
MSKIPVTIYGSPDKPLVLNGVEIPCYVLDNETRVITQSGLLKALGMSGGGSKIVGTRKIDEFLATSALSRFVDKDLTTRAKNAIPFRINGKTLAFGYEATILVDICDSIMQAAKTKEGKRIRKYIVDSAEMLIRAFAKVGIIAMIDEITGYQEIRGKLALQKFLDKFLLEEHAKYIPTYPDEFFETIYKMKGWDWNIVNKGKNPSVMGHYINNFIYSRVAPQILSELKKLNPSIPGKGRKYKHTQYIDKDFGHPKLKEHIASLIALGKASGYNWRNFQRLVNRALPKYGHSLELGFPDADIMD